MSEIVCLCGSTRFKQAFEDETRRLTLEGVIVLSVGCFGHSDPKAGEWLTDEVKDRLDALHAEKIKMADRVHVLNVDGYIGDSTLREISLAHDLGKTVTYLEPHDVDWRRRLAEVQRELAQARKEVVRLKGLLDASMRGSEAAAKAATEDLADLLGISVEDSGGRWAPIHDRIRALVETVELYERDCEGEVNVRANDYDEDLEGDAGLSGWMPAGSEADALALQAARMRRGDRETDVPTVSSDPGFVLEEGDWVRFNDLEAVAHSWSGHTVGEIGVDVDEVIRLITVWKRAD